MVPFSVLCLFIFLKKVTTFNLNVFAFQVNINKQKKEAFQILKPELEVDPEKNPHFDAGMGINKNKILRPKRMTFQFVEEGKWSKDAEIIKLKVVPLPLYVFFCLLVFPLSVCIQVSFYLCFVFTESVWRSSSQRAKSKASTAG